MYRVVLVTGLDYSFFKVRIKKVVKEKSFSTTQFDLFLLFFSNNASTRCNYTFYLNKIIYFFFGRSILWILHVLCHKITSITSITLELSVQKYECDILNIFCTHFLFFKILSLVTLEKVIIIHFFKLFSEINLLQIHLILHNTPKKKFLPIILS